MGEEIRKTGIDSIGDVRWGTHFCQFYQTKEDLIDILVPYFKAGLENNEFCMWVTSEPLNEKEAEEAMIGVIPDFTQYLKSGQIEIIPYTEWYTKSGKFDADEVLQGWVKKEKQALKRGFDGLRLTGNTFWLERKDWKDFADYEEAVNNVIGEYRILAICSYSFDKCGASEILDVVGNHQFALIRREGKWGLIESSDRKQAEEALRRSEEQLRLVTDALPVLISYVNSEHYYRFNNKAYEEWFGHPRSEVTGKHVKEVLGETVYQVTRKYFEAALAGQKVTYEGTMPYKDGGVRYVIANYVPHFGEGGEVKGFFVLVRDITERRQVEEEIRNLAKFPSENPNPVLRVAKDGTILYANKVSLPLLGVWDCQSGQLLPEYWRKFILDALNSGKIKDTEVECGNRMLSLTFAPVADANYVNLYGLDITDRKQAEEALRDSKEFAEGLIASMQDGFSVLDNKGVHIGVNNALCGMTGFSREELIGVRPPHPYWPPEEYEAIERVFQRTLRGEFDNFELTFMRKNGERFPVIISPSWLRGKQGSVVSYFATVKDITERKQAEEREKELQKELNLASRLASIGELAAGVAHEINNPLTGVMGFSQRLLRKSTDAKTRQDLGRIHSEAQRAAKIVENLLTFARHREPKKRYLSINDVLQKALELRAYELKMSNIEVATNFPPRLPRTKVDFHQMQEVFVNIILNAEQAMSESNRGGELNIRTQKLKDNIRISFTDDGPGIPAEHLDKVFNPFFTTRGRKGGTGLGLSVCHGIVERHGGRIYARSKPGKGATFFVELPITRVKR